MRAVGVEGGRSGSRIEVWKMRMRADACVHVSARVVVEGGIRGSRVEYRYGCAASHHLTLCRAPTRVRVKVRVKVRRVGVGKRVRFEPGKMAALTHWPCFICTLTLTLTLTARNG